MDTAFISSLKGVFDRNLEAISKENKPWYMTQLQPAYDAIRVLLEKVASPRIKIEIEALTRAKQLLVALMGRLKQPHPGTPNDQSIVQQNLLRAIPALVECLDSRPAELAAYRKDANAKLTEILVAGAHMAKDPDQNHLNTVVRLIAEWTKLAEKVEGLELGLQAPQCLQKIKLSCEKLWKAQQDAQYSKDHEGQSVSQPLCDEFKKYVVAFHNAKI